MAIPQHLRGHLLLFDAAALASYARATGTRLILAFVLLEAVIGPRFHLFALLGLPQPAAWIRLAVLLAASIALVKLFVGIPLAAIGLKSWREWSLAEKSHFLQVIVLANVVFAFIARAARPPFPEWALLAAVNFSWGFYQELVYRGMLQTELTRRFGAIAGVLLANVAYAFGPLHFYHFAGASPVAMFAAIFAIGLYFGVLRHRAGNLWMPAVFHGIGTAWILGGA